MDLFTLGQCLATPGAIRALAEDSDPSAAERRIAGLLQRHASGDWGIVPPEDEESNRRALQTGSRIFSVYKVAAREKEVRVWVITEADRASTTVLLPEEY